MSEPVAPPVTVEIEHHPKCVVVRAHGKLLWGSGDLLYAPVARLLEQPLPIVLDLADIVQMDSMGLGTLVRLYVAAKTKGRTIELRHLSKKVNELLIMTNLLPVFASIGEHGMKL